MAKKMEMKGGRIVVRGEGIQWEMTPEQAEKHLATFAEHDEKLSKGDASAIRDAARDDAKRREREK